MIKKGKVPEIQIGIYSGKEILFTLNAHFTESNSGNSISGKWIAAFSGGKIVLKDNDRKLDPATSVLLAPLIVQDSSFTLHAVTIGVDFHWQRNEDQAFKGSLKFITENARITAVNILSIEDYLTSVISSEMSATSSKEFLKAHAFTSRSWLLAQIENSRKLQAVGKKTNAFRHAQS